MGEEGYFMFSLKT